MAIYNRVSDIAFVSGLVGNVVTQVGTQVGYYFGSVYLAQGDSFQQICLKMWNQSAFKILWDTTVTDFTNSNWKSMGTNWGKFLLTVINYKAPNTKAGRSTQ